MTRLAVNRRFYDALWSASSVVPPQRFNTWPLLSRLAASAPARLEIGPGLQRRRRTCPQWGALIDVETVDELLLVCGRGGRPSVRRTAAQADALRLAPQSVTTGWRTAGREPS